MNYDWREYKGIVKCHRRAMNLCNSEIESQHLILQHEDISSSMLPGEFNQRALKDIVAETEKKAIIDALKRHDSIRKAARALGVTHATVINKMKQYKISQVD